MLGDAKTYINMRRSVLFLLLLLFVVPQVLVSQFFFSGDTESYISRAKTEIEGNRWEAAKKVIDQGLDKNPKSCDLRVLAGKYYMHKRLFPKARYELRKVLEYTPKNIEAKKLLIKVETETGRYSSAICYINELLEINPYGKGLWQQKIQLYRLQGNHVEANRLLNRLRHIYPQDTLILRLSRYETGLLAKAQREKGNIDKAIELRVRLREEDPLNIGNSTALINDYIHVGHLDHALSEVNQALNHFPHNRELILKKLSILSEQRKYSELFVFLQQEMNSEGGAFLREQYNYFMEEAARNAKNEEAFVLYDKILTENPGNEEAFNYVFSSLMGRNQYDEALFVLRRYKQKRGASKAVALKELEIYKRKGNAERVATISRELFLQNKRDQDLRSDYVQSCYELAKQKMESGQYAAALTSLNEVFRYADERRDEEYIPLSLNASYKSHLSLGDHASALQMLNRMLQRDAKNSTLYLKKAELLLKKMRKTEEAFDALGEAVAVTSPEHREYILSEYEDVAVPVIKELLNKYDYRRALNLIKKWELSDPNNPLLLTYAITALSGMGNRDEMLLYAQRGRRLFPSEPLFAIRELDIEGTKPVDLPIAYSQLSQLLQENPHHVPLVNTFAQASESYATQLLKEKKLPESLQVVNNALAYSSKNKSLMYLKGRIFERLNQIDSALYYQSFYEPSLRELKSFERHLDLLYQRGLKNRIGFMFLRARLGDNPSISSISSLEYTRLQGKNSYTGRFNYAGRTEGRGLQLQFEWERSWNSATRSLFNIAWGNEFFPLFIVNGSFYRELPVWNGLELEVGAGGRFFKKQSNLYNIVVGAGKEYDSFFVGVRGNNYLLGRKWLYNLSGQIRYYLYDTRDHFIAMAGFGTSPDVDVFKHQLFENFGISNVTGGLGFSKQIGKNLNLSLLGNWYHFQTNEAQYRNLYNLYLTLNVAF